jgi:hypothetical protein
LLEAAELPFALTRIVSTLALCGSLPFRPSFLELLAALFCLPTASLLEPIEHALQRREQLTPQANAFRSNFDEIFVHSNWILRVASARPQ